MCESVYVCVCVCRILKHLKRFSRELNVKLYGEELTKELFVEYRVKTIHFNTRSIALLARVLRMYIYMDLSLKKLCFYNDFNYCYYRFEITESSTCHQKHSLIRIMHFNSAGTYDYH